MKAMYNLFRSINDPTIICAYPDGGPVPHFLAGQCWTFDGKANEIRNEQFECDRKFVDVIVKKNGFFL